VLAPTLNSLNLQTKYLKIMDLSAAKTSRVIALEKLLSKCLDRR